MTNPRRGAPRPPADIEAEIAAAELAHDPIAAGIAKARYIAWATDHGWTEHPQGRPAQADKAAN